MGFVQARVSELIKRPPVTVPPTATVEDAVKLMYKEGVGSVVVASPEDRVLGIFTERDLVRVIGLGLPLTTKVGDVMTRSPLVVREDDQLFRAVSIMVEHRIRHLPIVDAEGRIKGVISARDIASRFKKYMEELGEVGE
ncbi:MAG: CBS domain-containing protein [Thermoprotei archaeon]|nr:CBS domain-containing protein [Thermoprotei archaeon]